MAWGTATAGSWGPEPSGTTIATLEISVYRDAQELTANITAGRSMFTNDDSSVHITEIYDVNNEFDAATGIWSPSKGKWMVSGAGSFDLVGDTNWAMVYLYNITQARIENDGGQGRNEGNGEYNSILACQLTVNGTDTFEFRGDSNDSSITLDGGTREMTYFQVYRFTDVE